MGERWMQWAVAEGMTRATGRLLGKFLGVLSATISGAFLVTAVMGSVQAIGGFLASRLRGVALIPSRGELAASIAFGVVATLMTTLAVYSFAIGADVGISTFILAMSIIPGAIIDWVFFGHSLRSHQWVGMILFIAAGYAMFDFPPFGFLFELPAWVLITVFISVLAAVNEGLSQSARAMDPFLNNFWVGITTVASCAVGLTLLNAWDLPSRVPGHLWALATVAGLLAMSGVSFKLMSYKSGGSIALKKLVMLGTYLTLATVAGIAIYGEPFTRGKALGVIGFFVAFAFMDRGTWEYVGRRFGFRTA